MASLVHLQCKPTALALRGHSRVWSHPLMHCFSCTAEQMQFILELTSGAVRAHNWCWFAMPAEYSDLSGAFIRDDGLCVLCGYTRQCVVGVCLQGWQGRSKYTEQSLPDLARVKSHWSAEEGERWWINGGCNALINTGISSDHYYKCCFPIQSVSSLPMQITFAAISSYLRKIARGYCNALIGCCLHHPQNLGEHYEVSLRLEQKLRDNHTSQHKMNPELPLKPNLARLEWEFYMGQCSTLQ